MCLLLFDALKEITRVNSTLFGIEDHLLQLCLPTVKSNLIINIKVFLNLVLYLRYVHIMKSLMKKDCNYLLDLFEYDTSDFKGPPHYITDDALSELFGTFF